MTRFDEFINNKPKEVEEFQELFGEYGCQSCKEGTDKAYFNEQTLEIIWFCPQKHRSVIQIG